MPKLTPNPGPSVCFLIFLMLFSLAFEHVNGHASSNVLSRERRTVSRSRQGPSRSQLTDVLRRFSGDGSFLGGDLSQYTPPTPRPQDVNCHVEIPTTTLVGGRCVNLGSDSSTNMVCQAGAYLAFNADCHNVNAARQRQANGNSAGGD
ncbi:hypothetical protein PoB_002492500 [Plakobranchus ocellatus]|uniref:Uncharacterized protein n=1 Tax=Plakobranchus ocellatus TaxID=259542 RepID=A0AAV3ZRN5_9GAST|nr:hypothetical protein PoB_002492500 [Plakobranchus ocellatus]